MAARRGPLGSRQLCVLARLVFPASTQPLAAPLPPFSWRAWCAGDTTNVPLRRDATVASLREAVAVSAGRRKTLRVFLLARLRATGLPTRWGGIGERDGDHSTSQPFARLLPTEAIAPVRVAGAAGPDGDCCQGAFALAPPAALPRALPVHALPVLSTRVAVLLPLTRWRVRLRSRVCARVWRRAGCRWSQGGGAPVRLRAAPPVRR